MNRKMFLFLSNSKKKSTLGFIFLLILLSMFTQIALCLVCDTMIMPFKAEWNSISYGNEIYVSINCDGWSSEGITNIGAYSKDGIEWKNMTLPSIQCWSSVAFGNGRFVALSGSVSHAKRIGAYSEDGITWHEFTYQSSSSYWCSVSFVRDIFIAHTGHWFNSNVGGYSLDGETWKELIFPSRGYWMQTAYGNGIFVSVGCTNPPIYSTNGIDWFESKLSFYECWSSVAYGNNVFAIISGGKNALFSCNGIDWNKGQFPFYPSAMLPSLSYGSNMFLTIQDGIIEYSNNGINWTSAETSAEKIRFTIYGNKKFVSVPSGEMGLICNAEILQ
jgi:hypothetical protein